MLNECSSALGWLEEKENHQKTMRKTDDPVLVTSDIKKKQETLVRVAEPVMNKPAPKPQVRNGKDLLLMCELHPHCTSGCVKPLRFSIA